LKDGMLMDSQAPAALATPDDRASKPAPGLPPRLRMGLWPCVLLLAGLVLSALAGYRVEQLQRRDVQRSHEALAGDLVDALNNRLNLYADYIRGIRALFDASERVSVADFRHYVHSVGASQRYGIQVTAWTQRVPAHARPVFEADLAKEHASAFAIRPDKVFAEYFVAAYVEPLEPNRALLGFNQGSEAGRLAAVLKARDSGELTASGRLTLVQDKAKNTSVPGFQLRLPVYRRGALVATEAQRRDAFLGMVGSAFRVPELIASVYSPWSAERTRLRVVDLGPVPGVKVLQGDVSAVLYDSHPLAGADATAIVNMEPWAATVEQEVRVGDRVWQLQFAPVAAPSSRLLSWLVGAGGCALSVMAAWLLWAWSNKRESEAMVLRLNSELEKRVQDRTQFLTQVIQELESFSHTVAHDLKAPLRSINAHAQVIQRDLASDLTGPANSVNKIQEAVARMGALLDGLLVMSRLSRAPVMWSPVNVTALVQQALERLQQAEPGRAVAVRVDAGMQFAGDADMLRMLVNQLIDNAWKFTRKERVPHIDVMLVETPMGRALCVRDNGPGFDMALAQRLFQPLQRLHRSEDFDGVGMGLAIARRVADRLQGRLWAEAAPGQGAAFFFSLPQSRQDGAAG
jgi:signal transduction histidine kinase